MRRIRIRIVPFLITLAATGLAAAFGWATWNAYMETPWTRDGTVRVYTVTMAPEVAGRIVELPVADNQFVAKGELLTRRCSRHKPTSRTWTRRSTCSRRK
jgi:multidrug resistance efflux pump